MSALGKRSRELVNSYGLSLELRVDRGDGSLVCRDEDLWKQAEGLLVEGNALDTHSLGLDPLKVMEESLTPATLPPQGPGEHARGGLRGLVKAFEVLELAALNLYLGPWRKEYKIVKMYSGLFTHYIKPVLSMPQILELFGLLGYQPCSGRYEQLRLQSVSFYSMDDLLHLACAFFLARCESRLLLSALGKHSGQPDWELSLVEERQRGHSIQVALDNTKRKLEVNPPLKEDVLELSGMEDLDLYTAAEVNALKETAVEGGETSSPSWVGGSGASSPAVAPHSNGLPSLSSPSASSAPREPICVSTFNYQLSPGGPSSGSRNVSATTRQSRSPYEDPPKRGHDGEDSKARGPKGESSWRDTLFDDAAAGKTEESQAVPQRALGDRGASALTLDVKGNVALSSSLVHDDASDPDGHGTQPIPYHDCCDLAQPDPRFLCRGCWVFHSGTCKGLEFCEKQHEVQRLGVCSCGKECSRNPLVLCRYCGTEYCNRCWYRRPVACGCGQTFDQSSAV